VLNALRGPGFWGIFVIVKKVFRYTASLSLSLLVLVASGGFTLSRMVCLQSGIQHVAFAAQDDCCKNEKNAKPQIKAQCCAVYNQHISTGHYLAGFEKHFQRSFVSATSVAEYLSAAPAPIYRALAVYRSRPPTLSGTDILLCTCKLSV
jgi:hypothetical protein